jgi:hypothetical protein
MNADQLGIGRNRWARRSIALIGAAVVLIVVLVGTTGLLVIRGSQSTQSTPTGGAPAMPAGTGVVARLPLGLYPTWSWSPDGAHLLVSEANTYVSRVYDRFGKLVSQFGSIEGWLDSTQVIDGAGYVADINSSHSGGPTANSWVVASGHGSAAIIVAVPACVGDPFIDWYRDGKYVKANEKATPFGWSPDGKLVLLGHLDCADQGGLNEWKGRVDVTDFATGKVLATAPGVSGGMAFNPSATRLAAQSDANLEIVDIATGKVKTVACAQLLGWADDDHLYCLKTDSSLVLVAAAADPRAVGGVVGDGWTIPSPAGPDLAVDAAGAATKVLGPDHKTTLLDLSSASLVTEPTLKTNYQGSALWHSPWSPDGRMLVLPSSDGTSLVLLSVDPSQTGAIGSALPTPVGSATSLAEFDRIALPGTVQQLVADAVRNSFWFLGGEAGAPVQLFRYDIQAATISKHEISGTTYDSAQNRLAIGPDGRLWIGAGQKLLVYDPGADRQTSVSPPVSDSDVQSDPNAGKPDPWISGIAFDGSGNAVIARNWVRSLFRVDSSLTLLPGRIDVSDGFPMTGGIVVAGGRAFVLADPEGGLVLGADVTGTGKLSRTKFLAFGLAAVGDRVLTAGTPPGWIEADGSGAMVQPVMAAADLVAAGPNGICALYNNPTGEAQWRDKDGKVSAQGMFPTGAAPKVATISLDAEGRLWAVVSTADSYALVRIGAGS